MKSQSLKNNLFRQLISIAVIMCGIMFISLVILLPKILLPIYEKNIYQYLKQPLELVGDDVNDSILKTDVAYLYVTNTNEVVVSANLKDIIKIDTKQILKYIDQDYGKFKYLGNIYYYYTSYNEYVTKISLTNSRYVDTMREDILSTIFPTMFITMLLILGLIILWSRKLVLKIEHLKEKIDNLGNDDYQDHYDYVTDDELKVLSDAIDEMKSTLKEQEEYKNQMYQNISHDFKTPLTVIKSYIEAIDDGVQDQEEGLAVINEQVDKLELKVHSLLYLNKLNYIKDSNNYQKEKVDVSEVVRVSVEKFKLQRSDIQWKIQIEDKKTIFNGTYDMWEAIIDNLLSNFMRYAEKEIKITLKNGRIILYNDGTNIDQTILDDIFTPYKKGIKGQFGLGLSIVKKTIMLVGYEVTVKNEKKGVSFIIK